MLTNAEKCKLYYERHKAERQAHQRAYYRANTEAVKRYEHQRYWADPGKAREDRRNYRWRNIDRIREHDRRRAKTDKHRRNSNRYYWTNRAAVRLRMTGRRQRQIAAAKTMFGNRCAFCGYDEHPEILQFDHVIPLKRCKRRFVDTAIGVLGNPGNRQLLCPRCHAIKTALWSRIYPPTRNALNLRNRREKLLWSLGARCRDCRYDECRLALQFDHIVPINRPNKRTRATTISEVAWNPEQFQILCANCHALKTLMETKRRAAQRAARGVA
jgi:5-methylcytosine-specific restriction endonuclease McrA